MLQGLLRACCCHLTLSGYNYPESFGSVVIDPLHRWFEFSPYWQVGGRSVPPLQLQIWSRGHQESPWLLVNFHTIARWHSWLWPVWDLDLGNSFDPINFWWWCKSLIRQQSMCRLMALVWLTNPGWLLGFVSEHFRSSHPICLWYVQLIVCVRTMVPSWDQSIEGCGIC